MGEPARWQQRVEEFVLGQIGDRPAQAFEAGCGEGELARAMARTGHSVTAIDPRAPEGPIFRRVRIEELSDPGPFDYVVASLSLHHVEDLGRVLEKIADLLRAGGPWLWSSSPGTGSMRPQPSGPWSGSLLPLRRRSHRLQRHCWEWARGGQGGARAPAVAYFAGWASAEGLHGSRRMLDELGGCFDEWLLEWVPYLSTRTSMRVRRRRTRARP